ncbi:GPI-anchor transamidase [Raphidocelis subcapitata]|uniref:GPI-anchor transamidase n=1 Tax=Raphidocelis subcapitata TaxID=307507 RepID=A0A2V0NXQ5_9CHLO|nr:GPI-anchor transamidase [Raphidocelis subcapitata]|eukprot:GBF89707.1 GPI-anchor transamidase [Raphidocelis subcapitata]
MRSGSRGARAAPIAALLALALASALLPPPRAEAAGTGARGARRAAAAAAAPPGSHTSNWAVLVCTSAYWYNYRHMANTLSIYRTVRRLGVPDSNIILMLADDVACNARNPHPAQARDAWGERSWGVAAERVFNEERHSLDVYGRDVEVDYRGYEVTVENFMRVLTGRHDPAVPRAKRMLSDAGSNVLIYITGHGGNEFIKFQDQQELMAGDVADAVAQMHQKGRYKELLLVVETCQASTLYSRIKSPGVLAMASSLKGESSYSYLTDYDVGLSLVDRFTFATLDFFEKVDAHSAATLGELFSVYRFEQMDSHFGFSAENFHRPLDAVRVTDFFGHVTEVRQLAGSYPYAGDAADGGGGSGGSGSEESSGGGSSSSSGGSGSGDGPAAGAAPAPAAAGVKGRLSGGPAEGGGEWGAPMDALTLGGIAGLIALVAGASLAWGGGADAS